MAAINFDAIPEETKGLNQWCCWKLETVKEKLTKVGSLQQSIELCGGEKLFGFHVCKDSSFPTSNF